MTHLADTRPIVSITTASTNPSVIGADLGYLLGRHPGLELASVRLIRDGDGVHIAGRVGTITQPGCDCYPYGATPDSYEGPQHHCSVHGHGNDLAPSECPACIAERECPSCHTVAGHPHTDYCQLIDHASQLTHAELEPNLTKHVKAARCICPGLGINPDCTRHSHDPAEDEPEQDEPQLKSHTVTIGARSTVHHRSLCKPEVCGSEPMP